VGSGGRGGGFGRANWAMARWCTHTSSAELAVAHPTRAGEEKAGRKGMEEVGVGEGSIGSSL
jgi:hypothetical protein